ncbi:hypothetical protein PASE110613_14920 [Paenibacillus sediminis]|uniref:Uncharacterized protein n=1 Tax=Paenibacillus sediminis TaxID=664909 RepID=A0ABS4H634_9BACL|nr:hypothetical protein [Paenibacillus sediminis]MBP1937994.1 hypothetical protein [Paenibacillus sediminis]
MKEELMKKSYEELKKMLQKDVQEAKIEFPVLEFFKLKEVELRT